MATLSTRPRPGRRYAMVGFTSDIFTTGAVVSDSTYMYTIILCEHKKVKAQVRSTSATKIILLTSRIVTDAAWPCRRAGIIMITSP